MSGALGLGFSGGRVRIVPATGKIYDITHADTNEHSVTIPVGYPGNIKALYCRFSRIAGTGQLKMISTQGTPGMYITTQDNGLWFRAIDGLFYYSLSVANDDWDVFIYGYIAG